MPVDDVKQVTIWKRNGGAGTKGYSNTYNIFAPGKVSLLDTVLFAASIGEAERNLASNKVFFDRIVISTIASKATVGNADKPKVVAFNQYGRKNFNPENLPPQSLQLLPPGSALMMAFEGDEGRLGLHPLRNSIGPQDWWSDGSSVNIAQNLLDAATASFAPLLQRAEGKPFLIMATDDEDGLPAYPITGISCKGYGHKQLTQKRGKSKGDGAFTLGKTKEDDSAELLANALEVITETEANRYNTPAARLFTDPKILGLIGSLIAAGTAFKATRDQGDFGPQPVG